MPNEDTEAEETTDGPEGTWELTEMEEAVDHLIDSIRDQRLVFFCGAGLSMGEPSSLPSADDLVQILQDEYGRRHRGRSLIEEVVASIEDIDECSIENIAKWALENPPKFQSFFLPTIRSDSFFQPANIGHKTVADFLIAEVAESALTTNVDYLIEDAAAKLKKGGFRAKVERSHLGRNPDHSPLLKLHGCFLREEQHTVWCEDQLNQNHIQARIEAFQHWIHTNLPGKDLVFVGYWTDWPYLNETLDACIRDIHPRSVTLVDPGAPEDLLDKAGGLWNWVSSSGNVRFQHVRSTGNDFLEHLRRTFSEWFFWELLCKVQGPDLVQQHYGIESTDSPKLPPLDDMTMEQIYNLRRDFQGVPKNKPASDREPSGAGYGRVAALHQLLLEHSGSMDGRLYNLDGDALRLVNSGGRALEQVKSDFSQAGDTLRGVKANVCVGSRGSLPGRQHLIRESGDDDVVRTGQSQEWWTDDDLFTYLHEQTNMLDAIEDNEE